MTNKAIYILSTAATDKIRTETYQNREYVVIPLVALVEGVLHSANSESPELALAAEFGKYAVAWDGRPVVMNHPQVNGDFVSANSPEVLEEWSYGQLFNTKLVGDKLITEAWIDRAKVNEKGGEMLEVLTSIENGEMVEVSTGLFAVVKPKSGTFKGNNYKGVWESIAPDHLAILSPGTIGACSNADGCGIPRINVNSSFKQTNNQEDCGCHSEGDSCSCDDHTDGSLSNNTKGAEDMNTEEKQTHINNVKTMSKHLKSDLLVNELPADMTFNNAREILVHALDNAEDCDFCYLCQLTRNKVVYFGWCDMTARQRSYTLTDNRSVTLGDDIEEVFLLTEVVPINNADKAPTNNSGDTKMSKENQGADTDAPITNKGDAGSNETDTPNANNSPEGENSSGANANPEAPKASANAGSDTAEPTVSEAPKNMADFLNSVPAELRDTLQESVALHANHKSEMIKELVANKACDFSEAELNDMNLQTLRRVAKLANIPTYAANASAPAADLSVNNDGSTADGVGQVAFAPRPTFNLSGKSAETTPTEQ